MMEQHNITSPLTCRQCGRIFYRMTREPYCSQSCANESIMEMFRSGLPPFRVFVSTPRTERNPFEDLMNGEA